MAPRFDPDSLTLELSVADLIDRRLARSLGFANRGGYERLWLGQAIHSRYQEEALEADPTYRREVWARHRFVHRGWEVVVSGRLDGLRRTADGHLVVEEIKSVRRDRQLPPPTRELYHRQAQIYAWLVAAGATATDLAELPAGEPELAAPLPDRPLGGEEPDEEEPRATREPSNGGPAPIPSHGPDEEDFEPDPSLDDDGLNDHGADDLDLDDAFAEYQAQGEHTGGPSTGPRPAIRAELILIEIGSDRVEREEVALSFAAIDALVRRRVSSLLRGFEAERAAAAARREAGLALEFPYSELRPGQDLIVEAVERALEQREHLLLEATTGIGKTVAALYPTLRYCLTHGKRLFVLTAKTLQQGMATQVLELLNQSQAFRSLRLRAKARMCANDQILCHEEYCPYAKDYAAKLQSTRVLDELIHHQPHLDPDAIYEAARRAEVCPFEVSLELLERVQVTVCDYNYAFDPYVSLGEFGRDESLEDTVLVVDEIHNLVDRGRGYYSPELSARACRETAEAVARGGRAIHLRLANLAEKLARVIDEAVAAEIPEEGPRYGSQYGSQSGNDPGGLYGEAFAGSSGAGFGDDGAPRRRSTRRGRDEAVEAILPEELLWRLRPAFDAAFVDYLEHQRQTKTHRPDDEFVNLYFSFLRFLNALVVSDQAFSHLVERSGGDALLKILCKDPSRFLGAVINRTHATVGLSATLSPPEFYRDLLGFDPERTAHVSVPNPFPAENRRVVIDPSIATTYKERSAYYPVIAERLGELADAVPGNCLALFPSYAFLARVAEELRPGAKRVLVQRRASGEREREEILETLRTAFLGDVLLLAVAGGVFAEGVDYPGDMLRAVAVVGPCLPALTLEQKLLSDYYQERFERGFEYAFVVPGMTRVVQAAGRLIRSPEDSGIIALLDKRFLHKPYRSHLPEAWLPEDGARGLTGHPPDAAAEFFAAELSR